MRVDDVDGLVGDHVEVLGGPPIAVARRIVDRTLEIGVGYRADQVGNRSQRPERRDELFALAHRTRMAQNQRRYEPSV
jgi:hypothetical protein